MSKKWIRIMELVNDGYFTHWNNRLGFFKENPADNPLDCSILDKHLYDKKGRMCAIELKTRTADINTFNTLFIEEKKWNQFKKEYEEMGFLPIYINFMRDGHHVWLIDLRQYFDGKKHIETKTVTINNQGYERQDQNEIRYLIPPRDGIYWEFDQSSDKYKRLW